MGILGWFKNRPGQYDPDRVSAELVQWASDKAITLINPRLKLLPKLRYADSGVLLIDNNSENAIRPIATGNKNCLFAGSSRVRRSCILNPSEPARVIFASTRYRQWHVTSWVSYI